MVSYRFPPRVVLVFRTTGFRQLFRFRFRVLAQLQSFVLAFVAAYGNAAVLSCVKACVAGDGATLWPGSCSCPTLAEGDPDNDPRR
jgi:hypothetical protein